LGLNRSLVVERSINVHERSSFLVSRKLRAWTRKRRRNDKKKRKGRRAARGEGEGRAGGNRREKGEGEGGGRYRETGGKDTKLIAGACRTTSRD